MDIYVHVVHVQGALRRYFITCCKQRYKLTDKSEVDLNSFTFTLPLNKNDVIAEHIVKEHTAKRKISTEPTVISNPPPCP